MYQAKKAPTSRINIYRRARRALDGSRIGLNYASVPSPGLNVNSSDKGSVYTANEGCGIIAPVIIDGELLPSWVTANTLVRVRHRILAAHGETGDLGELDPKSSDVSWHARICGRALGGCVVQTNLGAFQTDDDVPKQTNWLVKDLPRRGM